MTDSRNEESPAPDLPPPLAVEPAPPRAGLGRMRGILPWIVVVIVVALVAGSAPYWTPLLPWGGVHALTEQLAAAEATQQREDARVTHLETQVQQLAAAARSDQTAAALTALTTRVATLEQKEAAAAGSAANAAALHDEVVALTARLSDDEARLGKLAAQSSDQGGDRLLLVGLAQLRAALAGSAPFTGELAAVTALGHGNSDLAAALQPLSAEAATGIPSTAQLAQRFSADTAPAIFRAAAAPAPGSGSGWGERILARIRALVVIHRVNGSDPTDVAVTQAEHALADGDLAGAVAAVKSLAGAPAEAASPWLAVAEKRLAAESALATLSQQIATRVAGAAN